MVENFKYEPLKSRTPPSVPEGNLAYERSSLKVIDQGHEGAFNYEHLKTIIEENLLGWFVAPWFSDWFEWKEVFEFEHQRLKELIPTAEGSFEFENLKSTISPVTLNDDFEYKRL